MNNNPTITPQVVNSPFTNFCMSIGAIPTSYKDSLDYYETLLWLIKFLDETVIPAVTTNGNAVTELQGFYLQLQSYVNNYFDNLDVQEEINNKLDEMASDGTLADLLTIAFENAQSIARDTLFDTIEEAFEKCLEKNYILYLTKDYTISNDLTGLSIPSIIGNNNTIYYDGQGLEGENVEILNTNFINNTGSISNGYCLRLTNSKIEKCSFSNYVSPLLISGTDKSIINDISFRNCAQGVFTNDADNVFINALNFINTSTERTYYKTNLQTTDGYDCILVQNSNNVSIDNSYFEYCTERILYSSGSNNVTIQNCIAKNCNPFKFVGYDEIVSNFNCNNNILHNAFDDAFVQLYNCKNINITNNLFDSDDDSSCLGWFVRCGHYVSNVNCNNNKANHIKRSFIDYEDVFPNTITESNYVFSDIYVLNNIGTRMCLISGNHLPIIYIKDDTTSTVVTKQNININNNIFASRNYDDKNTWSTGNYTNSSLLYCKGGTIINIKDNDVKGIYDSNLTIPMVELSNSDKITIKQNVKYSTSQPLTNFASINGNAEINLIYTDSDMLSGKIQYVFNSNKITGIININQNGTIFYKIPKTWNILLNVLNASDFENIGIDNETPYVNGTNISTTLGNTSGFIYFYDTSDGNITLRTRTNRILNYSGIFNTIKE